MLRGAALIVALGVSVGAPASVWACTTFLIGSGGDVAVGKSYDWSMGHGAVIANPRGLAKRALTLARGDRPAEWVARYASVTFNQYGHEFPNGGMNEEGLVVEIMWLASSRPPQRDQRPVVNELQFIQYLLDTSATVADVLRAAPAVRVAPVHAKVHYLACDRHGGCAALEHVAGRLVVTSGVAMPAKVLTNDTYAASARQLGRHAGFGGKLPPAKGRASLARFVRAATLARAAVPAAELEPRAFEILESVSQGEYSKWNIVYLPAKRRISFRSHSQRTIKTVDMSALAVACPAHARMLDIDTVEGGDVTPRFHDYDERVNEQLVRTSARGLLARAVRRAPWWYRFVRGVVASPAVPEHLVRTVARYPGSVSCAPPLPGETSTPKTNSGAPAGH